MAEAEARLAIEYFDGVNSSVQKNLAKKTELSHMENCRAPIIGVLEKRQGQAKVGTTTLGDVFFTSKNYGLKKFRIDDNSYQGVFRVSATAAVSNTKTIFVYDSVAVIDHQMVGANTTLEIKVSDDISISEPTFFARKDVGTIILDGTSSASSIYSLTGANTWAPLSDPSAQNIIGGQCDFANADGNMIMVNGKDYNRMVAADGVTVIDSTEAGSLYNSPRANKVTYYKSRIYLANFTRNGIRYKTTILRSSYAMGIVSLVSGDQANHASGTDLTLTDTKYFYSDSGMNSYEVYRGTTLISTITVTAVNELSITITHSGTPSFLSSDEVWIAGTYNGAKQYRWVSNGTSMGKDVKQYDTFKLSGGDEDEITFFDTVGNILMVGNRNNLMTWNDYTLETFDLGIGCASPKGNVKQLGALYFLHYTGIYSTTGTLPTLISRKIEKYITGATRDGIENAVAGTKGLNVFFAIGDVTLYNNDGSYWKTLRDVCIEYSTTEKNFYIHTNVPADQMTTFIDSLGSERLLIAHTGTGCSVKEFLVGNTDDGDEIFFRADTQEMMFMQNFENFVHPTKIVTDLDRGTLVKTFISLDGDDFYEVQGDSIKGISQLKITPRDPDDMRPVSCRKMRVSLRESSKQRCRILQMMISYIVTSMSVNQ